MTVRRVMAILALAASLGAAGCAQRAPAVNLGAFERNASDGTMVVYWNCTQGEPGRLVIEGAAANPYYTVPLRDIALVVSGFDAQNRQVSRAGGGTADYQVSPGAASPFRLDLRLAGGEERFDLRTEYRGAPGGGTSVGGAQGGLTTHDMRDICGRRRR